MRGLFLLLIVTTSALAAPQRDDDGHAMVIVVDRAMTAAKIESVRLAVKDTELSHGDQFGIVAYGKTAHIVLGLAGGKSRAVHSTTEPTDVVAGLDAAHAMLRKSKKRVRRVIVVTDGDPTDVDPTIAKLRADGITVSAVGFESDNAAALAAIATAGKGRHYATDSSRRAAAAFQKELDRPPPEQETLAEVLLIDRSLYGASLELAKEAARQRAEALSPNDMIAVIVFDTSATEQVRPQRAANQMRISHDISRVTGGGAAAKTAVALQKAFDILKKLSTTEKRVVVFGTGNGANLDLVKEMAAADITISIAAVRVRESDRAALEAIVKAGHGQLQLLTEFNLRMR